MREFYKDAEINPLNQDILIEKKIIFFVSPFPYFRIDTREIIDEDENLKMKTLYYAINTKEGRKVLDSKLCVL